jgi:hypothetical protein
MKPSERINELTKQKLDEMGRKSGLALFGDLEIQHARLFATVQFLDEQHETRTEAAGYIVGGE